MVAPPFGRIRVSGGQEVNCVKCIHYVTSSALEFAEYESKDPLPPSPWRGKYAAQHNGISTATEWPWCQGKFEPDPGFPNTLWSFTRRAGHDANLVHLRHAA